MAVAGKKNSCGCIGCSDCRLYAVPLFRLCVVRSDCILFRSFHIVAGRDASSQCTYSCKHRIPVIIDSLSSAALVIAIPKIRASHRKFCIYYVVKIYRGIEARGFPYFLQEFLHYRNNCCAHLMTKLKNAESSTRALALSSQCFRLSTKRENASLCFLEVSGVIFIP